MKARYRTAAYVAISAFILISVPALAAVTERVIIAYGRANQIQRGAVAQEEPTAQTAAGVAVTDGQVGHRNDRAVHERENAELVASADRHCLRPGIAHRHRR